MLLTALLFLSAMTANATDKEIKIEAPADVPALMFTEAHKTDLTQYCTNAAATRADGFLVPATRMMMMAMIYPDAPLAKKYFSDKAVRAAQEAYLSMEDEKDIGKKFTAAAIFGGLRTSAIERNNNDRAVIDFFKNIYNDVAKACNQKYTGGTSEMFFIIK